MYQKELYNLHPDSDESSDIALSDDEGQEEDKIARENDKYEGVLDLHSDSDSDSERSSDIAVSDVEGQGEDDIPDVRAWGKNKSKYYSTDYVDPDYGGYQGKDATLANLEEEEAKNLHKQLIQELDDTDFALDAPIEKVKENDKKIEELVHADISGLTKRQKLELLQKESPEFFGLVEDFKAKADAIQTHIKPIKHLHVEGKIPNSNALEFVDTYFHVILNYIINFNMYLLLKASKITIQSHPIVKRLYQYRQLLTHMDSVFNEKVKPQIEVVLEDANTTVLEKKKKKKKKKNKTNEPLSRTVHKQQVKESGPFTNKRTQEIESGNDRKKVKISNKLKGNEDDDIPKQKEFKEKENGFTDTEKANEGEEKRLITYQIAKNKGLTPHRKKEQRNPRVKHRMKFRKAKIRRKGAVREVRKELSRYSGEMSGIKMSTIKSTKIK